MPDSCLQGNDSVVFIFKFFSQGKITTEFDSSLLGFMNQYIQIRILSLLACNKSPVAKVFNSILTMMNI